MATPASGTRKLDIAGLVMAAILLALAGLLWREAAVMDAARTVTYGVGPTAALKAVAIGLLVLSLATGVSALRATGQDEPEPMNATPVWIIMAACAFMIACLRLGGGFVPATAVLFAATATAFGRRNIIADLGIGFVLATFIYLLFSKLLTLTLPQGPFERLLG
ncbi:MAG: tripartite tricarboxylate transporter TctB family protein [Bosea sp. (in: a-proteobacteria)]